MIKTTFKVNGETLQDKMDTIYENIGFLMALRDNKNIEIIIAIKQCKFDNLEKHESIYDNLNNSIKFFFDLGEQTIKEHSNWI